MKSRDIEYMAIELDFALNKKLIPKLIEAQKETAKKVCEDAKDSAPGNGAYKSSIRVGETTNKNNIIRTEIYSDLKIGGIDPKWRNIPLANLINWGTGPLGEDTNIFEHNYPYTTDAPWNYIAQIQYELTGTWGMAANPHFYFSLQNNIEYYKKQLRKVFK